MPMGYLKWWVFGSSLLLLFSCWPEDKKEGHKASDFAASEIELGRKLFFFNGLSGDSSQSCGSCHLPQSGFTSGRLVFSNGVKRNVPGLLNLKNSPRFFWDGREKNLESLVIKPILNRDEMQGNLVAAIQKMNRDSHWKTAFKEVYGKDTIYTALISRSLAAYVKSLSGPAPVEYPDSAFREGKKIFQIHCRSCHSGPAFTDFALRRSVVAAGGPDSGHFRLSRLKKDIYSFKTPGLSFISRTSPYTHDGRFPDLESIVAAYSAIPGFARLKNEKARKALIRYLKTL